MSISQLIAYQTERDEKDARHWELFGYSHARGTMSEKIEEAFARNGFQRPERGERIPPPTGSPCVGAALTARFDDPGSGEDGTEVYHAREIDYSEVCGNLAGRVIPDEVATKTRERREIQDAQTVRIAKALECRGEQFYYGENHPNKCTVIGLHSGIELPLPSVRRTTLLPSVAAQQRSKMLRDIEAFLLKEPVRNRMYTLTNGPRVAIHKVKLRDDIQAFHRRLSKLSHKLKRRFGLVIQWRATEFGTPEWDPETGQLTLHLHAHLLVTEPASMHPKKRGKLRKKLWRIFGTHWDDAGTIRNVREFVKYPVKPGDMETILKQGGPGALADYYEAVKGLHIVQPMGELKKERARRKKKALRVVALTGPDGRYLTEKYDWNAGKRPLASPSKYKQQWAKEKEERAKEYALEPTPMTVFEDPLDAEPSEEDDPKPPREDDATTVRQGPRIANRIIARLAPAAYGGNVLEPAVVVWGYDGNLAAVLSQPICVRTANLTRDAYIRGRTLARACTRTAVESSQRSDNCPGSSWPLDLLLGMSGPPRDQTELIFN